MAEGAWVPAFDSLWKSPKTRRLAQELHVSRHAAGGMFLELMSWARDQIESGDLGTVAPAALAQAIGQRPMEGAGLLAALKVAGFVTDDERAHVRGWEEGPGRLIERRRQDRERQRRNRSSRVTGQHAGAAHGAPGGDPMSLRGRSTVDPMSIQGRRSSAVTRDGAGGSVTRDIEGAGRSASVTRDVSTEKPPAPDLSRVTVPVNAPLSRVTETAHEDRHGAEGEQRYIENPPSPVTRSGDGGDAGSGATVPGNGTAPGDDQARRLIAEAAEPWASALRSVRQTTTLANFVTWFRGTRLADESTVVAPNAFVRDWLTKHYAQLVREVLGTRRVRFVLEADLVSVGAGESGEEQEPPIPEDDDG